MHLMTRELGIFQTSIGIVAMIKYAAGAVLSHLLPSCKQQVERTFTMPYFAPDGQVGIVGRLIRTYIGQHGQRDQKRLESLHREFWRQQSPNDWFKATSDRLNRVYIPTFKSLVAEVHAEILSNKITTVVELGTGNGDWLAYLNSKWNGLNPGELNHTRTGSIKFIGIDLAEEQIAINLQRHYGLEFVASDLNDWVMKNQSSHTLFLTHCGVLEYLSESTLVQFLKAVRSNHQHSMVLFVEPIAVDFDLETEQHSRLQGCEFSFSHNYPYLLKQAGFQVHRTSTLVVENYRMLCTLAATN